jgi:hypothetical protein
LVSFRELVAIELVCHCGSLFSALGTLCFSACPMRVD